MFLPDAAALCYIPNKRPHAGYFLRVSNAQYDVTQREERILCIVRLLKERIPEGGEKGKTKEKEKEKERKKEEKRYFIYIRFIYPITYLWYVHRGYLLWAPGPHE